MSGLAAAEAPTELAVGEQVTAQWKMGRKWWSASVVACNADGTFSLIYEDGDGWDAVPRDRIRRADGSPLDEAVAAVTAAVLRSGDHGLPLPRVHAVLAEAVDPGFLRELFPQIKHQFQPMLVQYSNTNPNIAPSDGEHGEKLDWKVSSYMEVDARMGGAMQKSVTCDLDLLELCRPLLRQCNDHFRAWYEQLHGPGSIHQLVRLQSFITRYRPLPQENALLRHIDGAQVDGSVILGLPTDSPFVGGGITVWERAETSDTVEASSSDQHDETTYRYPMNPGDMCLLDNYVWHQGNPITAGERWSLVIFYGCKEPRGAKLLDIIKNAANEERTRGRDVHPASDAGVVPTLDDAFAS